MIKKVEAPCNFNGQITTSKLFFGAPKEGMMPVHNQLIWYSNRGGSFSDEFLKAVESVYRIAKENNLDPEELLMHVIEASNNGDSDNQ